MIFVLFTFSNGCMIYRPQSSDYLAQPGRTHTHIDHTEHMHTGNEQQTANGNWKIYIHPTSLSVCLCVQTDLCACNCSIKILLFIIIFMCVRVHAQIEGLYDASRKIDSLDDYNHQFFHQRFCAFFFFRSTSCLFYFISYSNEQDTEVNGCSNAKTANNIHMLNHRSSNKNWACVCVCVCVAAFSPSTKRKRSTS